MTKLVAGTTIEAVKEERYYYYRTWKTDAPCCRSFRTTGGCGGALWPSLFVVDMLPLFALLLPPVLSFSFFRLLGQSQ